MRTTASWEIKPKLKNFNDLGILRNELRLMVKNLRIIKLIFLFNKDLIFIIFLRKNLHKLDNESTLCKFEDKLKLHIFNNT